MITVDRSVLNVLVDITPAATPPQTRTGLARVAIELAYALVTRDDVSLRTCAWGSLDAACYMADHMSEFESLSPVAAAISPLTRRLLGIARTRKHDLLRLAAHRALQAVNRIRNPLRGCRLSDIDVIHSTYSRLPRVARRSCRPAVVTVHDITPLRLPPDGVSSEQRAITARMIRAIRPNDWVACVSDFTRRDFLAYTGHRSDRAVTVPNGVDFEIFRPRPIADSQSTLDRLGIAGRPFVMTLSSLAGHKNLQMLLRIWPAVVAAVPDAAFVVAGGKTTNSRALRDAFGIPDTRGLVVTGRVSDGEFCDLATRCNAFLFPSLYEGFGLPALEAMAAGAPVIAADNTSLPEVVGKAGTLLDPHDADAWRDVTIQALRRGLGQEPHAESIRQAASFSWERTAAGYVALYRRMLATEAVRR